MFLLLARLLRHCESKRGHAQGYHSKYPMLQEPAQPASSPPVRSTEDRKAGSRSKRPSNSSDQNLLKMLVPGSLLEYKIIAAICAVRFALVPFATQWAVGLCAQWGFLPADHVCMLAILIQVETALCHSKSVQL